MNIKKNDTVSVIAGKDKGKTGKVMRVLPTENKIIVEGIAIRTKHVKARKAGEIGQKIFFPAKIDASKVMVVCPKCGKSTRVGYHMLTGENIKEKKERVCKKCGQVM